MTNSILHFRIAQARMWMFPASIWWVLLGLGTFQHLAGHPTDAPHLHINDELRGYAWAVTGILSLVILLVDKRKDMRGVFAVAALLVFMPMVRAVSYTWAWYVSFSGHDNPLGVGPAWLEGDPNAYYTCLPWWAISGAIICLVVDSADVHAMLRRLRGRR